MTLVTPNTPTPLRTLCLLETNAEDQVANEYSLARQMSANSMAEAWLMNINQGALLWDYWYASSGFLKIREHQEHKHMPTSILGRTQCRLTAVVKCFSIVQLCEHPYTKLSVAVTSFQKRVSSSKKVFSLSNYTSGYRTSRTFGKSRICFHLSSSLRDVVYVMLYFWKVSALK